MWIESFDIEEREALSHPGLRAGRSVLLAALGLVAAATEVVVSIGTAGGSLSTSHPWPLCLLSVALGLPGPYSAVAAWRSPRTAGAPRFRRLGAVGLVVLVTATLSLAWLLLLRTGLPRNPPIR